MFSVHRCTNCRGRQQRQCVTNVEIIEWTARYQCCYRYIEDSIKVQRAGLTDTIFFRDIRMANTSMTANHNFGLSTDDKCDNLKDKHALSMEEAKRHLSNEEYRDLFTKVDDMFYDSNNPPF